MRGLDLSVLHQLNRAGYVVLLHSQRSFSCGLGSRAEHFEKRRAFVEKIPLPFHSAWRRALSGPGIIS